MIRLLRIIVCSACLLLTGAVAGHAQFRKGVSLPDLMTFPATVGTTLGQRYLHPAFPYWTRAFAQVPLDALRKSGFDHVRVTMDLGPAIESGEELQSLHAAITVISRDLARQDLGLVLTFLAPALNGRIPEDVLDGVGGEKFERYLGVIVSLASVAQTLESRVLFEPLNEPQQACRKAAGDWQDYQRIIVARVRQAAPRLPLLLTGGCWSKIEAIPHIPKELLADPNAYVSVHFYDPFVFTHQTTAWALPFLQAVIGVPYPAAAGSVAKSSALASAYRRARKTDEKFFRDADAAIAQYFVARTDNVIVKAAFGKLEDWRKAVGIPAERIMLTEFGAIRQMMNGAEIERGSRMRWLRDVRREAEGYGYGWTVWAWGNTSFGILEPDLTLAADAAAALGVGPIRKP